MIGRLMIGRDALRSRCRLRVYIEDGGRIPRLSRLDHNLKLRGTLGASAICSCAHRAEILETCVVRTGQFALRLPPLALTSCLSSKSGLVKNEDRQAVSVGS